MDLSKAVTLFEDLKAKVANHGDYIGGNETVTRVLLVDPVLKMLGWDVTDPALVVMEFATASQKKERADYLLRIDDGVSRAIVEAKKYDQSFRPDNHKTQADGYANYAGVEFFIITDGARWALYKRDVRTRLEDLKPVIEFDIEQDDPVKCALNALGMWRSNLISDGGPTEASQPLFGSTPNIASHLTTNQSGQKEKQSQLRVSSAGHSDLKKDGWFPLTELDAKWHNPKPSEIRFKDSTVEGLKSQKQFFIEMVYWLALKTDREDWSKLPEASSKLISLSSENVFTRPFSLPKGIYLETNRGWKVKVGMLNELFNYFKDYDLGSVYVKFDRTPVYEDGTLWHDS